MPFINLSTTSNESWFNLHYHIDFIELHCLSQGDLGLDFSEIDTILHDKNINDTKRRDCIAILEERADRYGEKYPFTIDGQSSISRRDTLTDQQKLYVFLLMCSYTNKIDIRANSLQTDFERLSQAAIAAFLPNNSVCHMMGSSSATEQRYVGSITDKLTLLASDLSTQTIYREGAFAATNNGDGGLDIVAWTPFQGDIDSHFNMPLYIGQCATGKDWKGKQDEPTKLRNYLALPKCVIVTLFLPYDGRNSDGTFNHQADIRVPILFDRHRIMNLVDTSILPTLTFSIDTLNDVSEYEAEGY